MAILGPVYQTDGWTCRFRVMIAVIDAWRRHGATTVRLRTYRNGVGTAAGVRLRTVSRTRVRWDFGGGRSFRPGWWMDIERTNHGASCCLNLDTLGVRSTSSGAKPNNGAGRTTKPGQLWAIASGKSRSRRTKSPVQIYSSSLVTVGRGGQIIAMPGASGCFGEMPSNRQSPSRSLYRSVRFRGVKRPMAWDANSRKNQCKIARTIWNHGQMDRWW